MSRDWSFVEENDVKHLADIDGVKLDRVAQQLLIQKDGVPAQGVLGAIVASLLVNLARAHSLLPSLPQTPLPLQCTEHDLCLVVLATVPSIDVTISFRVLCMSSTRLLVLMFHDAVEEEEPSSLALSVTEFLNTDACVVNNLFTLRDRLETTFFVPLRRMYIPPNATAPLHKAPTTLRPQPSTQSPSTSYVQPGELPSKRSSNPYLSAPSAGSHIAVSPFPPRPASHHPLLGSNDLFPSAGIVDPSPFPAESGGMLMGPNHPMFAAGGLRRHGPFAPRFDPSHPFSLSGDPAPDHLFPPSSGSPFG